MTSPRNQALAAPPVVVVAKPQEPGAFGERGEERAHCIESTVAQRGVRDEAVLAALRRVPRHAFVPKALQPLAYADQALPIGSEQTISQPYMVGYMCEALGLTESARVLEIGTGSGYQAAVLAELCSQTFSIEYLPRVAASGAENLRQLGYSRSRLQLRIGDGYNGWSDAAPFDAIVAAAAPTAVPPPLLTQLAMGGRLVIPIGELTDGQEIQRWTRLKSGESRDCFGIERGTAVRFVPFLGRPAQPEADAGISAAPRAH